MFYVVMFHVQPMLRHHLPCDKANHLKYLILFIIYVIHLQYYSALSVFCGKMCDNGSELLTAQISDFAEKYLCCNMK